MPIFKHELVHEASVTWNTYNKSKSVDLVKCHLCYKIWLVDTKDERSNWKWKAWSKENLAFSATYWLTMLAFTLGWEPKSIDDAKYKSQLYFNSILALFFIQLAIFFIPLVKLVLEWIKEIRKDKLLKIKLARSEKQLKQIEEHNKKMKEKLEELKKINSELKELYC